MITLVSKNLNLIEYETGIGSVLRRDICEWLDQNIGKNNWDYEYKKLRVEFDFNSKYPFEPTKSFVSYNKDAGIYFHFNNEEDSLLFALVWLTENSTKI